MRYFWSFMPDEKEMHTICCAICVVDIPYDVLVAEIRNLNFFHTEIIFISDCLMNDRNGLIRATIQV
jgi:hypothetical protein